MSRSSSAVHNGSATAVLVVGAGNIGSHLLPLLAREPRVERITIVDRDRYEPRNLAAQAILPRDAGRPKVDVQARHLRRLRPGLDVRAEFADLLDVPLGALRADAVFGCLDSRAARRDLSERLWKLGVPLVDAGVQASGWLARVSTYVPGADAACVECAWDDEDYLALDEAQPCDGSGPASTNAPAALGALAASLAAGAFLSGMHTGGDSEVVIDAVRHRLFATRLERNPRCRAGHEVWAIEPLPEQCQTLARAAAFAGVGSPEMVNVRIEGQAFAVRLRCRACGRVHPTLRLVNRLRPAEARCSACGGSVGGSNSDLVDPLSPAGLPRRWLRLPLRRMGIEAGDVLSFEGACGTRHFEVGAAPAENRPGIHPFAPALPADGEAMEV